MLEQVEPDAYDERYKKWHLATYLSFPMSGSSDRVKLPASSYLW
ncbi:hypothetical protein JCM19233_1119 [Vibrio astriarenae]|nr:hypothetical protein JCM19233_1119 [Vibrio sp. C7]